MDNTKYIALSRQMALWKQMDIVSNNMANMNTSGYKQDDAIFASYLTQTKNAEGFGRVPVYFTQDFGMYKDFKEGAIPETLSIWLCRGMLSLRLKRRKARDIRAKVSFSLTPTDSW